MKKEDEIALWLRIRSDDKAKSKLRRQYFSRLFLFGACSVFVIIFFWFLQLDFSPKFLLFELPFSLFFLMLYAIEFIFIIGIVDSLFKLNKINKQ